MSAMKSSLYCLLILALSLSMAASTEAAVLLDDDFDNGDLATGGTNGGFSLVSNGAGGPGSASESGGNAVEMTTGNNDNSGIVSNSGLDIAGQATGVKMTFVIASMSADPGANGMFLGLQNDSSTFYRSGAVGHNFGLVFSGNEGRTASGGGFGLVTNDIGNPGSAGNGTIFDDDDLQLSSLQDGFTAVITADATGWSYEISGVNDTGGTPTVFSNSGTWVGSGEAPTFYNDFFDNAEHAAVYVQRSGTPNITTLIDRITVESKMTTVIPEPSTYLVFGGLAFCFGAAGWWRKRRKAA